MLHAASPPENSSSASWASSKMSIASTFNSFIKYFSPDKIVIKKYINIIPFLSIQINIALVLQILL